MEFQFMSLEETKSETKLYGNIYLFDLFFIFVFFCISAIFGNIVSSGLKMPYYIYSLVCALWLTSKSRTNRRRRNYEALILFLRRDMDVYKAEMNVSMKLESEADNEEK